MIEVELKSTSANGEELLEQFDAASDRSLSAGEDTAKGASPETGKKKKKKSFVDRMKDALDG